MIEPNVDDVDDIDDVVDDVDACRRIGRGGLAAECILVL